MDAFRGQQLFGIFNVKYLTQVTNECKGFMVVYRRNRAIFLEIFNLKTMTSLLYNFGETLKPLSLVQVIQDREYFMFESKDAIRILKLRDLDYDFD